MKPDCRIQEMFCCNEQPGPDPTSTLGQVLEVKFPENMHLYKWKLKTVADGNDKGSWYSWQIEKVGMVDSMDMYNECKEFHNSVASGEIKATAVADEIDQAPSVNTDEVPF